MSMNPPLKLPRIPKVRKIENPAVPGMEGFLPPPPPPPPPRISNCSPPREIPKKPFENKIEMRPVPTPVPPPSPVPAPVPAPTMPIARMPILPPPMSLPIQSPVPIRSAAPIRSSAPIPQLPNVTYPNIRGNSMYQVPPQLHGPPIAQSQQQAPWWIPTDSDNNESYSQWYEKAYKAALVAVNDKDSNGKPKVKYFKQKSSASEVIDAQQDADEKCGKNGTNMEDIFIDGQEKVANAQKELAALMKPLKCDLCNAVMNSTLQAKLHYDGKPHQKKVSMFLNQNAKMRKSEDGVSSTTTDWNSYCEICKTWFTSHTDAAQHYAGKKHMRAAYGGPRARTKKGHSNQAPTDPTGRFNIGNTFLKEAPAPVPPKEPVPSIPPVPVYVQPPLPYPAPLRCELCNISTNRQDQLDTHMRGAKHLKMLKQNGLPLPNIVTENTMPTPTTPTTPIDYSIYRTPSGQYYCAPCNLSVNSEVMFGQHMESKRHKNQVNPKNPIPVPSASTKKSGGKKK